MPEVTEAEEWAVDPPSDEDIWSLDIVVGALRNAGREAAMDDIAQVAGDLTSAFHEFNAFRRRRGERLSHRQCAAIMEGCASTEATVRLAFRGASRTRLAEGLRAMSCIAWTLARNDRAGATKGERYDDLAALCVRGENEARCRSIEAKLRERERRRRQSSLVLVEDEREEELIDRLVASAG